MTPIDDAGVLVPPQPSYWAQWLHPQVVLPIVAVLITLYVTQVLQAERLESMRVKVDALSATIERDYQRRDVLSERLQNIDGRMGSIEGSIAELKKLLTEARR